MGTRLVERAQHGDREAFEALAVQAIDRLYGAAILILGDRSMAEDAVQEAFLRAWRGLPKLRDRERWDAWLHRVLLNACMDVAKSVRMPAIELEPWFAVNEEDSFETEVDARDEVSRALARLNPRQRAVLVLRYFLGLSVPELAQALGVPLGTAKSRLHHALGVMRAEVDADGRVAIQGGVA
jgi:RNA polymerase sigma-70 factor (ECF subfamily)